MAAMVAIAWTWANEKQKTETTSIQEYYCPHCNVQLQQAYVKVGERRCGQCKGKGWYGYGHTKEECRKNKTLCDPCNYCEGKGIQDIKDYRWVCSKCQGIFK